MRQRIGRVVAAAVMVPALIAAVIDARGSHGDSTARNSLTLLVPAAPGGTWDTIARELQHAMKDSGVVANPQVVNVPGAAGTIGLSELLRMEGRTDVLMLTGTVMLGGIAVNKSRDRVTSTTPIAKISEEYPGLYVPANSPYKDLGDFLGAWRKDPRGTVIGGGSLGGTDSLVTASLARKTGIDPRQVNYIAYSGGGEVLPAVLSSSVDLAVGGYMEFEDQIEAGNIRALAVSAPERLPGVDIPTLKEQRVDLHLPNWQGLVTAPGVGGEDRDELAAIVRETLVTDGWRDALKRNRWGGDPIQGPRFERFLAAESVRVGKVVKESGL